MTPASTLGGSRVTVPGYRDVPQPDWDPDAPVDPAEAEDFLRLFNAESPQATNLTGRLAKVRAEIADTGTYQHTHAELVFGARVAWRNASRCIGRLYWRSLVVRDLRKLQQPDEVFEELVNHLTLAGQRERSVIRPMISIFAPHRPGQPAPARLWNEQLIRYAGHRQPDGTIVRDPPSAELTGASHRSGGPGEPSAPLDELRLASEAATIGGSAFG